MGVVPRDVRAARTGTTLGQERVLPTHTDLGLEEAGKKSKSENGSDHGKNSYGRGPPL